MTPPHDHRDLTDAELAKRAADGSAEAFAELVARYETRLFSYLRRFQRCRSDAEDVTQEAFIRAWRFIDRYDARYAFSTWLFTIASRCSMNLSRDHRKRSTAPLNSDTPALRPSPERQTLDREQSATIWSVAEEVLTEEQRAALWLRYVEQLPMADIAAVLDKNVVAVRVMLHRAKQRLRRALPATDHAPAATARSEADPRTMRLAANLLEPAAGSSS